MTNKKATKKAPKKTAKKPAKNTAKKATEKATGRSGTHPKHEKCGVCNRALRKKSKPGPGNSRKTDPYRWCFNLKCPARGTDQSLDENKSEIKSWAEEWSGSRAGGRPRKLKEGKAKRTVVEHDAPPKPRKPRKDRVAPEIAAPAERIELDDDLGAVQEVSPEEAFSETEGEEATEESEEIAEESEETAEDDEDDEDDSDDAEGDEDDEDDDEDDEDDEDDDEDDEDDDEDEESEKVKGARARIVKALEDDGSMTDSIVALAIRMVAKEDRAAAQALVDEYELADRGVTV